jgi:uncharacterized protein (DUF486 family)
MPCVPVIKFGHESESLRWNYLWAGLCPMGAVNFMFKR